MASDGGEQAPLRFEGPRNFYCHQCHSRTRVSAEEFSCSSCGSGFIEEISVEPDATGNGGDDPWDQGGGGGGGAAQDGGVPMFGENTILEQLFAHAIHPGAGGGGNPFIGSRRRNAPGVVGDPHVLLGDQFFQSLISNLTGVPIAGAAGGHPFQVAAIGPLMGAGGMYGNPGDYAWGRGGFDAIVTQLLNQMEGTGPPPMTKDSIRLVPETKVTQEHIDQNLQCSVCWEDFKLEEKVRRLNCDHIFHPNCIVPWLELHATCPVCRKPLTEDAKACQEAADREYNGDGGGGGAAGGGAPQQRPGDGSSANTTQSSSDTTSASTHTQQQEQQQQQQRPSSNLGDTISLVFNQLFGQGGGGREQGTTEANSSSTSSSQAETSTTSSAPAENTSSSDMNGGERQQGFRDFDLE